MFRIMCLGDLELTRDRLPIARPILEDAAAKFVAGEFDLFVGLGDFIAEYCPDVVHYLRDILTSFRSEHSEDPIIIIGNHDYNVPGIDKLTSIFAGTIQSGYPNTVLVSMPYGNVPIEIITTPKIKTYTDPHSEREFALAFLPAPNRAAFGASRGAETNVDRNKALTNAMDMAVGSIHLQLRDTEMENSDGSFKSADTILFAHATPRGAVFPSGAKSTGLTWEIPTAALDPFAKSVFGHIHRHYEMNDGKIVGVGSIAPWTHGDKDIQYHALAINIDDDGSITHEWIPLLRQLFPVELFIRGNEIAWKHAYMPGDPERCTGSGELTFGGIDYFNAEKFISGIDDIVMNKLPYEWDPNDTIALKLRYQLPHAMMANIPPDDTIRNILIGGPLGQTTISKLTIARERTDASSAIRITSDAEKLSLGELFIEWLQVNGHIDDAPIKPGSIVSRACELLESEFAGAQMFQSGNFGIVPRRLKITNFRQWKNIDIDFDQWNGAVAITGRNALGKSNLLESILFMLFKRTPSSSGLLADEINKNESTMSGEFVFDAGDEQYKINRAVKRTKKGANCKTDFMMAHESGDPWNPVVESAGEIEKAIAKIVSSYEFVITTFFGTQREIDRLINSTPTETHQLMLESMSLQRFDTLHDIAAKQLRDINKECDELITMISSDDKLIMETAENCELYGSPESYDPDIKSLNDSKTEHGKMRDAAAADLSKHDADRRKVMDGQSECSALNRERERNAARIAILTERSMAKKPVQPEPLDIPIKQLEIDKGSADDEHRRLLNDIINARSAHAESTATCAALRGTIERIGDEMAMIDDECKKIMAGERPDVPCDAHCIDNHPPLKTDCVPYRAYTSLDRRDQLMERRVYVADELKTNQSELDGYLKSAAGNEDVITRVENDITAALDAVREIGVQINTAYAQQRAIEKYHDKMAAIDDWLAETEKLNTRNREIDDSIAKYGDIDTLLVYINDKICAANETIRIAQDAIERDNNQLIEIERKRERAKSYLDMLETLKSQKDVHEKQYDRIKNDAVAWTLLSDALSKNGGIPYLIMEKMAGAIESETNRILAASGCDITVEINTTTETQKGESRDRVEIRFNDHRGNHPLSSASGYQCSMIGMPLRAGFSKIGSEFWGMVPAFFVQDEGWDRFHASARPMAGALIAELAAIFTRFIYISHIDDMSEFADIRVDVYAENGNSAYKIVS